MEWFLAKILHFWDRLGLSLLVIFLALRRKDVRDSAAVLAKPLGRCWRWLRTGSAESEKTHAQAEAIQAAKDISLTQALKDLSIEFGRMSFEKEELRHKIMQLQSTVIMQDEKIKFQDERIAFLEKTCPKQLENKP